MLYSHTIYAKPPDTGGHPWEPQGWGGVYAT